MSSYDRTICGFCGNPTDPRDGMCYYCSDEEDAATTISDVGCSGVMLSTPLLPRCNDGNPSSATDKIKSRG